MVLVDNRWGDPAMLPGPPKGSLRTREDPGRDSIIPVLLAAIIVVMIVVPLVIAAFAE